MNSFLSDADPCLYGKFETEIGDDMVLIFGPNFLEHQLRSTPTTATKQMLDFLWKLAQQDSVHHRHGEILLLEPPIFTCLMRSWQLHPLEVRSISHDNLI
jgi:hypothetical protein